MIHVQIVGRKGANVYSLIRRAITDGNIRAFALTQVKGGLRIRHQKFLGDIRLTKSPGPVLATLVCKNRAKEFQLLESFVGRLVYHFKNDIASINIQLEPT